MPTWRRGNYVTTQVEPDSLDRGKLARRGILSVPLKRRELAAFASVCLVSSGGGTLGDIDGDELGVA